MKKIIFLIILLILTILAGYGYVKYFRVYSEGIREGEILKVSYKGFIFKTYECEMVQAGLRSAQGNLSTNNFKFTALNKEVASKIETATGKMVRVKYYQYQSSLPWRGETYTSNSEPGQYIVYDAEVVGESQRSF